MREGDKLIERRPLDAPDREEVIKAITNCLLESECKEDTCPYYHETECQQKMAQDALALLKAQEPRVMTLSEALKADYVYLEIKLHASLPCECCILAIDPDGGILPLHKGFCAYLDGEEYGETWRCWTQRPTDEQRRAELWDRGADEGDG